jgi:flagellar basal-body rod protein FlgF
MASGIYTAMTGAVAQSQALDVAANNIANAETTGFRAERMTFAETMAKRQDQIQVGISGSRADATHGEIRDTGNPLDAAIDGEGYFALNTPAGVRYTRAGDFRLDDSGNLVSADGFQVRADGGGSLSVPSDAQDVHIADDGSLVADGDIVGQIQISKFAPASLSKEGGRNFVASAAPLASDEPPIVLGGALEGSNFQAVRGVIDLVKISRVYEALHRMVETYKQLDERTARDIGGK